jgi:hypothetical protein
MMDKAQFIQKVEEIKKKYNKIHKILFTYGIFLLIWIFSCIKLYAIFSTEDQSLINKDPLASQKEIKIRTFLNKIESIKNQQTLTGQIALWQFEETKENIESFNNLLYYKGFIVPRFFLDIQNSANSTYRIF